jgi:hypothetical protein
MRRYDPVCTIEGCGKRQRSGGFCTLHYQRWRRHGDPDKILHLEICTVDGCEDLHKTNGLCAKHYQRAQRNRPGARIAESERTYFRNHDMSPEEWAALWDAQAGRCYMCGELMEPRNGRGSAVKGSWLAAVIDHDHGCCPADRSCAACRRGLAHNKCNRLAGLAADDPAFLRRIADGLDAARAAARRRGSRVRRLP